MKIALCLADRPDAAERRVAAMLDAQRHAADCAARLFPFDFGCLGLLGRPGETESEWPLWRDDAGGFVTYAGLPIAPGRSAPVGPGDAPRDLDGAFVSVAWHPTRRTLTVTTDFLGMQPLYRADVAGMTLFASEAKAFVRAGALDAEPDAGAWGAMLVFGHQIGPRALLRGAARVPPAHVSVFTGPRAESASTTWRWPEPGGVKEVDALVARAGDAVRADVRAYAAARPDAAILLSGGFDSRLILALCHEAGVRPRALVQSHPDENADADARFAEAFARSLGVRAERREARADFYGGDDYLRFLERNEVATPSLYLFIPNVAAAVDAARPRGVWEGLLLDPALKFDYGDGGFDAYLRARAGARGRAFRDAARLLFRPEWRERIEDEYDALLAAERARFTDDADGVWRFSVLNRSRFRTGVNPYQVYDAVTPPLTPGMSRALWEAVAVADPRLRYDKRLYLAAFARLAPGALSVPVVTGASLLPGTGGSALYHAQRARAALQRLAQRPRVRRLLDSAGLPRPFAWAPSRFLDVALAEASLDDPRLDPDWIRRARAAPSADARGADALARETLFYWQAWHHVVRGGLIGAWGTGAA